MDEELKKICIPFTVDTNELLSITDILISDYSSIFFDFLSTGKPILFYVPDVENYTGNRGLYFSLDEMPGPVSETIDGVADFINDIDNIKVEYADKYNAMRNWCCAWEDGKACDKVIDSVFLGKEAETLNCKTEKEKILIMADFTKPFLNQNNLCKALNEIDYNKYDVTLLTGKSKSGSQNQVLEDLNHNVRILINDELINYGFKAKREIFSKVKNGDITLEQATEILNIKYEWKRLVGDSKFHKLYVFEPTVSLTNWMILSYFAPIDSKHLITGRMWFKTLFDNPAFTTHFQTNEEEFNMFEELK